jgi:dihydrolipoamide dehydrogenase
MQERVKMYDLVVLGGGPGGYVAAIRGAQKGLKVLLIEKDSLGGTCLNRGCIPTKCFVRDSKLFYGARNSSILMNSENLNIDPIKMVERKRKVVNTLISGLAQILGSHAIKVLPGKGELLGPGKIRVLIARVFGF